GAFFSIDWDTKNEHKGQWVPAGGSGWEKSVCLDMVSKITAAELQSSDPEALAERWSVIAGLPLHKDSKQRLEMKLNNASVRFVEATDGRGEGLGGIDLAVNNLAKVIQNADDRGLKLSENQVMICGVRFNLR
ncbi:hypothetical protein ACFLZM_07025, partial [Thermodesulfobacteriota bacterium]